MEALKYENFNILRIRFAQIFDKNTKLHLYCFFLLFFVLYYYTIIRRKILTPDLSLDFLSDCLLSYVALNHKFLCANVAHRKFRHLVTGIKRNPTGTPLEVGISLAIAGKKNRMTFLERDKRLFTGRNGQPLRQIRAIASVYVSYSLFSCHVSAVCLREEKGGKFR